MSAADSEVNQLAILAREYLDDNKNRDDVESMVKGMLQASTAIVSLSRQLKRFEKTVDSHFCCFWNECKGSCQFKNKNAWRTEVADVYTSFESSLSKPSVIKSSSSSSLTHVWLEELNKSKNILENHIPQSSAVSVSCDSDDDFEVALLEERLLQTEKELIKTKSELEKMQSLVTTSKSTYSIPPYTAEPITNDELEEIKRLQGLEASWVCRVPDYSEFPLVNNLVNISNIQKMKFDNVPPYVADPITDGELKEIKRLQKLENSWIRRTCLPCNNEEENRLRLQKMETPYLFAHELEQVQKQPEIIVGGVPEHFNYPWHMAIEQGLFTKAGLNVRFVEVPGGTGEMMRMLRAKEIDIAVALTEGIVANIANDTMQPSDVAIIGTYVSSPLTWGISVDAKSPYTTVSDLYNAKIGISRFGSGSHLMSFLLAEQQGWKVKDDTSREGDGIEFVVKSNITKMVESLQDGSSDVFLWETFMTKPYYDSGVLRKVGEIVTPWPCFLAASRREFIGSDDLMSARISKVMNVIRDVCATFKSERESSVQAISALHKLKLQDANSWFSRVAYPSSSIVSGKILLDALSALRRLNLIQNKSITGSDLVDSRVATYEEEVIIGEGERSLAVPCVELVKIPSVQAIQIRINKPSSKSEEKVEAPLSARASARREALAFMKAHVKKY